MDRSRDSYRFKSRLSVLGSASAYRLAANRLLEKHALRMCVAHWGQ